VAARDELIRVSHLDLNGIAGELGIGADKLKAACLAHGAAAAIAANEPASAKALAAGANGHVFARLIEILDAEAAPDLHPHRACASGQGGFKALQLERHAGASRTWQAIRPLRGVDVVIVELDAGEMAARAARLLHPMRGSRRAAVARLIFRALRRRDVVQQPATVEGFDGGRGKAAHAEREPLQGGAWVFGLLQHREVNEVQLTGEKQADRACTGNYNIMNHRQIGHELLLYGRSTGAVRRFENHTDEQ
jgi:hypothetical protein